jgi:hypothetical protein
MEEKTTAVTYRVFGVLPGGTERRLGTAKTFEEAIAIVERIRSKFGKPGKLLIYEITSTYEITTTESGKLVHTDSDGS